MRVDRRRTRPPSPFPDDIFIPEDVKHIPFETWPRLSVRLLNILGHQGYTVFGDLHGLKLSRLARLRSCGCKSITELGRAIQRVQRRSATGYVPPPPPPMRVPPQPIRLVVPPACRALDPYTLPMSARVEKVLKLLRLKRLGDLDGLPLSQLRSVERCGRDTAREIQNLLTRAANGEFVFFPAEVSMPGLASEIENMLLELPERSRKAFLLRFGGGGQPPATLGHIARRFQLTREAVRQLLLRDLARLYRRGGPRRKALFDDLAATCLDNVLPLTPGLFRKRAIAARPLRFTPEFYVRLIALMRPDIPAWLPGPQPRSHNPETLQMISQAVESLMEQDPASRTLPDVFQALRSKPACSKTTLSDFLLALRTSSRLRVQFAKPDCPRIILKRSRRPAQ